ncbi:MAG: hypothetical protein JO222_04645, partial [Frankiales bacterium]|nr:hypothetical protein [Frankiales bacterium]
MLRRSRAITLALAGPMSLFAYHPLSAVAAPAHHHHASCDGLRATMVVTSHSPHTVHGSSHRDVIAVLAAGHVVKAGKGNDVICGSNGHDALFGQAGRDTIFGEGGNDDLVGGSGSDDLNGNGGN